MPKPLLPKRDAGPPTLGAIVALAWMVAVMAALQVCDAYIDGHGMVNTVYFLGLAGGAAYLAMALPRRVVSAWRACRELASAIGTINLVVLPSMAVGWAIALGSSIWAGIEPPPSHNTQTLAAAVAATALPWSLYHALSDERVRSWFCVADCR